MPMELAVHLDGQPAPVMHSVQLDARNNVYAIDVPSEPTDVQLDPNHWVLMEATFGRGR
jgi:hypothetical protein